MERLTEVLLEARRLLALPDNDFTWSSFQDQDAALRELDAHSIRGTCPQGHDRLLED